MAYILFSPAHEYKALRMASATEPQRESVFPVSDRAMYTRRGGSMPNTLRYMSAFPVPKHSGLVLLKFKTIEEAEAERTEWQRTHKETLEIREYIKGELMEPITEKGGDGNDETESTDHPVDVSE